ncbi:CpaD family pilus assembly protein [Erythrobacter sp. JK5]|uniref:CpaD family pilus assembly protein n=1 Tax=Erythrobacter sp. JK5 TaxID=2829500 RepID=UPI001BAE09C0|nr:CpaD family pilus assembly protein [Erythrobacter sp. JK5]QUL36598.1 CpaD family pilus assembly protein [Erythrobacter sp. JK5]
MPFAKHSKLTGALALSLGLAVAGCAGMPTNTSLYSDKQPVVERTNFTFDVQTNGGGLAISEQQRLNGWFETMDLRYGDRITVEDPSANPAVADAVSELASRYGLIVGETAPTTAGYLNPGQARVVITRTTASVPGCPDWSAKADANYLNGTSPGYGCSVNSNMAAMVADPQDLLEGKKGDGETTIATSNKAISTYRETAPSGAQGLQNASAGNGGGN